MPFYDSFPPELCRLFQTAALKEDSLEELRLRVGQPLALRYRNCEYGITGDGRLTENLMKSVRIDAVQLEAVLEALSACSLYAFAEETRQGFSLFPADIASELPERQFLKMEKSVASVISLS